MTYLMRPSKLEFEQYNNKTLAIKYLCSVRTIQRWRSKLCLKREGWGPNKLNMEKACEIRYLYYQKKMTQVFLAAAYGVSQAAIGRIVNNITYKEEKNVGISGTSSYFVSYLFN